MRAQKRLPRPIHLAEASESLELESLVERARSRDVDAFRTLFEHYGPRVHRYVAVRIGRTTDAEDVVQEIFLGVWRGLPTFRYEHAGSFPGWLFGIARHVVAEHLRRALGRATVGLDQVEERSVEFEGDLVSRRALVEALNSLPASQREVLVLRFVVGLTARQAGEALGKSEGAVTSLQVRGIEHLRARMGAEG